MPGFIPTLLFSSGYSIPFSADFIHSASGFLYRTMGAPSNNLLFTWGAWIKFSRSGNNSILGTSASPSLVVVKDASNKISVYHFGNLKLQTTTVFSSAVWYHVVFVLDFANGTLADRIRIYVNGTRDSASATSVSGSDTIGFNSSGNASNFGLCYAGFFGGDTDYHDGPMAQMFFLDGTGLTDPIAQGWLGAAGIPIDISGNTFTGNNSFYCSFANSGALGTDDANANDLTVSGTVNQSTDVPV